MAEQTVIGYEQTKEWQQFQTGGTRVDADDLNRMEVGIVDACDAVDQLRTKRLPTYVVAQDGDTATQDVYMEPILGPCLILDLATRTTYYDDGTDEDGHRKAITSGADIDELRDSLSRMVLNDALNDQINDVDYCCKHTFIGLFNGYSYDPLWGYNQMFIVINRGTMGTGAYQIAFAYNNLEFRARKYEGSGWSQWFAL